jgi:hypothetical protein
VPNSWDRTEMSGPSVKSLEIAVGLLCYPPKRHISCRISHISSSCDLTWDFWNFSDHFLIYTYYVVREPTFDIDLIQIRI